MSAINERVSPKRLDTIKSWRETYGQDANVMIPASEAESIISELQQYRAAAEPVAWRYRTTDINGNPRPGWSFSEEASLMGLYQPLYAGPQVTSMPDGIEAAARWVDAQREAYDDEHGRYDPDTGTFEFGNDAQLEYSTTLAEIAEGIRALRPTAAPAVQAEQQEPVSQPYTLREGLAAIRNLGPIDAEKIQAERDALNEPDVPDGYALVPIRLTAENGAKGLLSGEFSETKFISCPECFGDDECETCDGSGRIEITVPVSWTTIKEIWAKGVEHFAAAPKQEAE